MVASAEDMVAFVAGGEAGDAQQPTPPVEDSTADVADVAHSEIDEVEPADEAGEEDSAETEVETSDEDTADKVEEPKDDEAGEPLTKSAKERAKQKAKIAAAEALAEQMRSAALDVEERLAEAVTLGVQYADERDELFAENARLRERLASYGDQESPEARELRELRLAKGATTAEESVRKAREDARKGGSTSLDHRRALANLKADLQVAAIDAGLEGGDDDVKAVAIALANPGLLGLPPGATADVAAKAIARARGATPLVEKKLTERERLQRGEKAKAQLDKNSRSAALPKGKPPPAKSFDSSTTGMLDFVRATFGD